MSKNPFSLSSHSLPPQFPQVQNLMPLKNESLLSPEHRALFCCHVYLTCYQNLASSQSIGLSLLLHHRHLWQLNTSSKSATTHTCAIVKLVHSRLSKQVRLRPSKIKLSLLPEPDSQGPQCSCLTHKHKYIQYSTSFMDLMPGPHQRADSETPCDNCPLKSVLILSVVSSNYHPR